MALHRSMGSCQASAHREPPRVARQRPRSGDERRAGPHLARVQPSFDRKVSSPSPCTAKDRHIDLVTHETVSSWRGTADVCVNIPPARAARRSSPTGTARVPRNSRMVRAMPAEGRACWAPVGYLAVILSSKCQYPYSLAMAPRGPRNITEISAPLPILNVCVNNSRQPVSSLETGPTRPLPCASRAPSTADAATAAPVPRVRAERTSKCTAKENQ